MAIIFRSSNNAPVGSTLPINYRDKAIDAGTVFLYDFLKKYSYPLIDTGSLNPINGTVINNLVAPTIPNNGSIFITATPNVIYNNGLDFTSCTTNNYAILSGNTFVPSTNDFLAIAWVKTPSAAPSGAYSGVFGRATNTAAGNVSYVIDTGLSSSNSWRPNISGTQVGSYTVSNSTVYQIGLAMTFTRSSGTPIGAVHRFFVNGELQGSATTSKTSIDIPTANNQAGLVQGFGQFTGKVFRQGLWDLTVGGRSAATIVAQDYALNNGRFS